MLKAIPVLLMSNNLVDSHIRTAANIMHDGGIIAYPTEAVWGLGCDPYNVEALERVIALKQRDPTKGLILVASSIDQFNPMLTDISPEQRQKLEGSWPGAITWLVPNNGHVPALISGSFSSIALRVSPHPIVQALCNAFGGPIVSTSANPQGKPAAVTASQVRDYFQVSDSKDKANTINAMTEGSVGNRKQPSTIKDLVTDKVFR